MEVPTIYKAYIPWMPRIFAVTPSNGRHPTWMPWPLRHVSRGGRILEARLDGRISFFLQWCRNVENIHIMIDISGQNTYTYTYINIYIYMVPPPQNLCRLQFYWYLQWILYILAPILFRLNLRHQQWENWKTEKLKNWKTEFHRRSLGSILLLWNSVFQFFSFSVLGFSWKVKTRKAEKTEKLKNWIP